MCLAACDTCRAHKSPLIIVALSECWDAYNAAKPAKETCSHCGEALAVVEGKFNGSFLNLGDDIKVHGGFTSAVRISSSILGLDYVKRHLCAR